MTDICYDREALIRWYDAHSPDYDENTFTQNEERYGGDAYRIRLVRALLDSFEPGKVLDIGCGTAEPMLRFLRDGIDARGFDLSPGMIQEAKIKLERQGYAPDLVGVDDILDPGVVDRYGKESFDTVIANGVLPYIEDCRKAHAHIARLIRPGGRYISAYSNELLDLMTLNRFTVRFHQKNFIDPLPLEKELKQEVVSGIEGLLTHPDKPESIPGGARDDIYVGAHNPLTIGETLKNFGLALEDMLFYKFHAFPPLLKEASKPIRSAFLEESRRYEVERARDWRGYFLASTFIVLARKQDGGR